MKLKATCIRWFKKTLICHKWVMNSWSCCNIVSILWKVYRIYRCSCPHRRMYVEMWSAYELSYFVLTPQMRLKIPIPVFMTENIIKKSTRIYKKQFSFICKEEQQFSQRAYWKGSNAWSIKALWSTRWCKIKSMIILLLTYDFNGTICFKKEIQI